MSTQEIKQTKNRERVEKHIYYDKKKKMYYIEIRMGIDHNGKSFKKVITCKTLKEAKEYRKELLEERVERKRHKKKYCRETLKAYCERYIRLKSGKMSETTIKGYKNILRHISRYKIADMAISNIEIADIEDYRLEIEKYMHSGQKISPNTINKHLAFLSGVFKDALERRYVVENPVRRSVYLDEKEFKHTKCSIEGVEKIFELTKGTTIGVAIYIVAMTGMRAGELNGLRWENVDLEYGMIRVRETRVKGENREVTKKPKSKNSRRSLPIDEKIVKLLKAEKYRQEENRKRLGEKYCEKDYVFCKEDGSPYAVEYLTKTLHEIIKGTEVESWRLHDLRRAFATILINIYKVSIVKVSRALGHSKIETTIKYYVDPEVEADRGIMSLYSGIFERYGEASE